MRRIPCTLAAAWLALWQSQATAPTSFFSLEKRISTTEAGHLPGEAEIKLRISTMRSPIGTGYDADVRAYLIRYLTYGAPDTEAMLGRGMIYLPVMEHYLELNGLPIQLKYLPMVESALLPHATSTRGAAGLWQLLPETARSLGLVVDDKLDERKDPNRSSEAAVRYLKRLRKRYGNWELALVAYNCGPGRLNKAMRQAGCDDYAAVKPYLPKETQAYLAKYLAATYIANFYHHHQLAPALPDMALYNAMAARVYGAISLNKIASATGVGLPMLRQLNPSFKSDNLPAREVGTFLTLPRAAWRPYLDSLNKPVAKA